MNLRELIEIVRDEFNQSMIRTDEVNPRETMGNSIFLATTTVVERELTTIDQMMAMLAEILKSKDTQSYGREISNGPPRDAVLSLIVNAIDGFLSDSDPAMRKESNRRSDAYSS